MSRLRFPKEILDAIVGQALESYPEECCGILSGYAGRHELEAVAIHQMENVYDRYRDVDPEVYPRTARSAYLMDPTLERRLLSALDSVGTPALCIYHSHTGTGPALTDDDLRQALDGEGPAHPGVEYLVVSVDERAPRAARSYAWDGRRFVGREVPLDGE